MSTETFIRTELSKIERIVKNETYLASERAGRSVDPHSPEIQCRVADILLAGAGEHLRNLIDSLPVASDLIPPS